MEAQHGDEAVDGPLPVSQGERVYYRDLDSYNKALDLAWESIESRGVSATVRTVIWMGLLATLAGIYCSDWFLDWPLRFGLGFDLAKPVWLMLIAFAVVEHVRTRRRHARIRAHRLCMECGVELLAIELDDDGGGVCPSCGRAFNVGEYRRPDENRGRGFHGYIDQDHFEKAMYAAAEHLRDSRGLGVESDLLGWGWLALVVCFGLKVVLDWDLFDWVPGGIPVYLVVFVGLLVLSSIHAARVRRLQPDIEQRRLCVECGFCLLQTPVDAAGIGRCPECGSEFCVAQYSAPDTLADKAD